jgi:hypothetical protein
MKDESRSESGCKCSKKVADVYKDLQNNLNVEMFFDKDES